ncbi:hypothetical protein HAX54_006670, partial [Datura stramonium]|nr:hypothetical protein [Datura stramonium]
MTEEVQTLTTPTDAMTEALSPSQASPNIPSLPKWDGILGALNTIEKPVSSEDNEDEQPLTSKWRKLKRRVVEEQEEVHPNVILDKKDDAREKAIDDDVVVGVMLRRSKASGNKQGIST